MGIANAIRDVTSFGRISLINKAVDAQVGMMRGIRPLQQTTGADLSQANIAACKAAVAKASVTNVMAAKTAFQLAGSFLDVLRDKLENMLNITQLAQNQDLVAADITALSTQFSSLATDVTSTVNAFTVNGTAVWGTAAYDLGVPVDGTNVTFSLIRLDPSAAGNLSVTVAALTFIGTQTAAAALASGDVVRGYLGLIAAQESVVGSTLNLMDSYVGSLEQRVGQNSAIVDEKSGYDIDDASGFMSDVLSQAQGGSFGEILGAAVRDIQRQVAMRLLA